MKSSTSTPLLVISRADGPALGSKPQSTMHSASRASTSPPRSAGDVAAAFPSGVRVVLVSAVYPPEPVVSAREAQDIAHELVRRNCRVTVICPQPSRPLGTTYESHVRSGRLEVTWEDGVEVVRLSSFTAPKSQMLGRAWESFSFGRHACAYLQGLKERPDVLSVNSWPLAGQALLARYACNKRIPLVLHVKDIYPESLIVKLPMLLGNLIRPSLMGLDRWIAKQAKTVVVISENMRRIYEGHRQIAAEKVVTISSWQDENLFRSPPDRAMACAHYGVEENRFTFLYLGNIGPVAGVDLLIRSFAEARIIGAQLLIAGGGSARQAALALVEKLRVKSVHFISDPDARNVPLLQSMAHVCLLPMKRGAGMSSIPSKLPAYMFSAKPVLASVDAESDTANAIAAAQCGWIEQPESLPALAARMRHAVRLPEPELRQMGERGRAYGLKHFSKETGVQNAASAILNACSPLRRYKTTVALTQ